MGDTIVERPITGVSVEPLRERVRGHVLTASDEGYDEARAGHNGMFDKRPLEVLRAALVTTVIAGAVAADGKVVRASSDANEALCGGLRGGGGTFGAVTSLGYRIHSVDQVFAAPLCYNMEDADSLLRMFDEFIRDAPEQFGRFPA